MLTKMNAPFNSPTSAHPRTSSPSSCRLGEEEQNTIAKQCRRLSQEEAELLFKWLLSHRAQWRGESPWLVARCASISLKMPIAGEAVRQMRSFIHGCVSMKS